MNPFLVTFKSETMLSESIINLAKENKIFLLRALMGSLLSLVNFV
jgi:hypothetical protein